MISIIPIDPQKHSSLRVFLRFSNRNDKKYAFKSIQVNKPKKQIKLHQSPSNTLAFQYSVFTYCLYFYRVANGKVASTEHQPPFYSGAELEFKCNLGFRLMQSRKKLHNRLICHDSGHWQPPRNYKNPKCIRKQCQRPRPIPYGRIITQVSTQITISTSTFVCPSVHFFHLSED